MKRVSVIAAVAILVTSAPAYACMQVTPEVRSWAQCSYKVAYKAGEHKFLVNFGRAKWLGQKLLPNAQGRWDKLKPKIISTCGKFSVAAAKDQKNLAQIEKSMGGAFYVPESEFEAIADTSDIDKLVKK